MTIWDRFRLDGKRALITGGSRGLGRAIALALGEAGADLVLIGRSADMLRQTCEELRGLGRRATAVAGDVSDPAAATTLCERIIQEQGPIHILINNVGGRLSVAPTEELSWEDWQRVLDVNLTSAFICCKAIGGAMVQRRSGRIINVASIAGLITNKGVGGRAYEAAKAGLVAFTRAIAADWAPHGVAVNAIVPGGFLTDPIRKRFSENPTWRDTFLASVPMGRLGIPEEIGPLAVFLASGASSYMTGAAVVIDGGYTLW